LRPQEFALIEKFLPKKKITKPRKYSNYQLFKAILYVLISGCQHLFSQNEVTKGIDKFTNLVYNFFGFLVLIFTSKIKLLTEFLPTNK